MQRFLPFMVFAIVLGLARVIGSMTPESFGNLQPLGALFFCGMALFGWRGVILPAAVWLVTYPLTNMAQGYGWSSQLLIPLLGFVAMVGLASFFRKASPTKVFLGSLASAVAFYVITNTLSWAFDPLYAPKSLATLGQALWTGLPQHLPTWSFFRNSMISQTVFSLVFLYATYVVPQTFPKKTLQTAS